MAPVSSAETPQQVRENKYKFSPVVSLFCEWELQTIVS